TVDNIQPDSSGNVQTDHYTKAEVDSKTSGTVVTAYDVASKKPTTVTNSYTSEELVDQGALGQFADQINQLKGRQAVDAPDFNTLTDTGVYFITNPQNSKNVPSSITGILTVFNGNGARITQIYFADNGTDAFMRTYGWINNVTGWFNWTQIAWKSDITNLQNQIQADKTDVTNLQSMITGLSTKVDSLQQNSHNIVPITQADYDALSTKDPNTIYAIGG
ncbi:pyocin knob domain-containing protein, partial [Lactobacillus acetotolerans]|uniref:pyocin knob domain-containing protein n=1 Tax=Lactobacillus acetotolerans TaxID=1600 RepID=UPI002481729E